MLNHSFPSRLYSDSYHSLVAVPGVGLWRMHTPIFTQSRTGIMKASVWLLGFDNRLRFWVGAWK
jgi:hypothetical protein